jgi:hypothetical protein
MNWIVISHCDITTVMSQCDVDPISCVYGHGSKQYHSTQYDIIVEVEFHNLIIHIMYQLMMNIKHLLKNMKKLSNNHRQKYRSKRKKQLMYF